MKGQAYMILAVFLAIAMLSITMLMDRTETYEVKIQDVFLNVKNEIIYTIDLAVLDGEDVSVKLDEFILFSEQYLESRGYEYEISYVINSGNVEVYLKVEEGNSYIQDRFNINRVIL